MNKKLLIPMTILATLAVAGTAYANPSTASATCQGGIVYEGHDYPSSGNTVTVKIDGGVVLTKTFGPATSGTVPFPDKFVGHSWAVVWDRYNGTDGDRTQSGTVDACVVVVPTTTTPVTTIAATTTLPQVTTTISVTTVATEPDPTTTVVAVDTPPVPCPYNPTVPAGDPLCTPPTLVASDVVTVEPALPRTGLDGTIIVVAAILVIGGVVLVLRGRRVS